MSSSLALALLAAALLAAGEGSPRAGPAEAAFWRCWQQDVTSACIAKGTHADPARFEQCKAELATTKCTAERALYEKELAAGLASDALDLLASSMKRVCAAEAAAHEDGRLAPAEEEAIAAGWREALAVRTEFMQACERSGRKARDCDDQASQAERRARASCPGGR